MSLSRPWRRCAALTTTALAAGVLLASTALAQNNSELSGFVYIDRNNDGSLAFSNQASPEWVLPGVSIELYSVSGSAETLLATAQTDGIGQYLFTGLAPGAYALKQIQPVEYVDGIDSVGTIRGLSAPLNPSTFDVGAVGDDMFTGIVLPAGARGDLYNFGERGLAPAYVSKRFLLASAPEPQFAPIPEPAAGALAVLGALAAYGLRRR